MRTIRNIFRVCVRILLWVLSGLGLTVAFIGGLPLIILYWIDCEARDMFQLDYDEYDENDEQ